MSIKQTIKNELWQITYILPFIRKYKNSEKGMASVMKHALQTYRTIKPIRCEGKKSIGADIEALLNQIQISINNDSYFVYFLDTSKTIAISGNVLSNFTLDYDLVIHGSFEELATAAIGTDEYGTEAKHVKKGVEDLKDRIIASIKQSNHPQKDHLIRTFSRLLDKPAEHFDEALQRILFFNQILWQTRHRLNGLGRLDKILGDLYDNDIENGYITEKDARGYIHDFLTELSKYPEYKSDALQGDIGQIIILGGLNQDDSYFYNELTFLFLQEQALLSKPDPKTLLRVSKKMPEELLSIAIDCLTAKTGSPLFSNDDIVIPALIQSGIETDDAYTYCVSACWEPLIVGKSIAQNNIAAHDHFAALDEVLEENYTSFDELVAVYIKRNQEKFKELLTILDNIKWAKDPLVSLFMKGSAESRIDISQGGCKYPNYGITTVALSNVVDSLLMINKLVFEEKKYSLEYLNNARKNDFVGTDDLYKLISNEKRFYGHDDDKVINLVNTITQSISETIKDYNNPLGGKIKFGLSSPDYNILSKKTIGDMSGRKAGMPYNTHISCKDAPYTEIVNFAGRLNYEDNRYNGNVVDMFVPPNLIEQNKTKFKLFMEGAIQSGFFQMQMNIMDSKTLIDAKAHPEKYQGLIVRVWGFSAYFNDLPESYKDLMIERALAAEKIA